MKLRILCLGDVVGPGGVDALRKKLWGIRRDNAIDFAVVNGENCAVGNGIDPDGAQAIFLAGADVITTGNHIYRKKSIADYIDSNECLIRPANLDAYTHGNGYVVADCAGVRVLVMNVAGRVYMDEASSPFETVSSILEKEAGNYDVSVLDMHAEATSEKYALARYFDGRVDVVFGTHTHVQTSDAQILPAGTGYVTDLGMCGPKNSILGVRSDIIINRFVNGLTEKFEFADGEVFIHGAVFETVDSGCGCTFVRAFEL